MKKSSSTNESNQMYIAKRNIFREPLLFWIYLFNSDECFPLTSSSGSNVHQNYYSIPSMSFTNKYLVAYICKVAFHHENVRTMWSDSVKYEIIQQDKYISNALGEKHLPSQFKSSPTYIRFRRTHIYLPQLTFASEERQ